jgi:hypothetical protein
MISIVFLSLDIVKKHQKRYEVSVMCDIFTQIGDNTACKATSLHSLHCSENTCAELI